MIGFAVFLGAIIVLGRAAGERFGTLGAVLGAVLAGLADIDAVSVSMARLAPLQMPLQDATLAILAAVASNNIAKAAVGAVIGRGPFARRVAVVTVLCLLAAALAWGLTAAVTGRR